MMRESKISNQLRLRQQKKDANASFNFLHTNNLSGERRAAAASGGGIRIFNHELGTF